ncbi:MAG: hypothetical protein ACUVQ8_06375 [Nitrososphaeria archaeon]
MSVKRKLRNVNIYMMAAITVALVAVAISTLYQAILQESSGEGITISRIGTYPIDFDVSQYNMKVVGPTIQPHNLTHIRVDVKVLVDNLSEKTTVDGVGLVKVYDSEDRQVGLGKMKMYIPPKGHLEEPLTFYVSMPQEDVSNVFFNRTTFNYRLEAEFRSDDVTLSRIEKALSIDLGVPVNDLRLGAFSNQFSNMTYIKLMMPLNFTNDSGLIEVKGYMNVITLDDDGNMIGFSEPLPLDVTPGSSLASWLTLYLNNNTQPNQINRLHLRIQTSFGTAEKTISFNK